MKNNIHSDVFASEQNPLGDKNLQAKLINALSKLQHRQLDTVLLEKPLEPKAAAQPYFGFSIAKEQFVVSAHYFCEVFSDIPVAPLPNASAVLLGLANLRGLLLPIYQLHEHLQTVDKRSLQVSLTEQANFTKIGVAKKKFILVIGKGDRAVGLVIDGLPVSLSLVLSEGVSAGLPHLRLPQLAQTYVLPDKTVALLDAERLAGCLLQMANDEMQKL